MTVKLIVLAVATIWFVVGFALVTSRVDDETSLEGFLWHVATVLPPIVMISWVIALP